MTDYKVKLFRRHGASGSWQVYSRKINSPIELIAIYHCQHTALVLYKQNLCIAILNYLVEFIRMIYSLLKLTRPTNSCDIHINIFFSKAVITYSFNPQHIGCMQQINHTINNTSLNLLNNDSRFRKCYWTLDAELPTIVYSPSMCQAISKDGLDLLYGVVPTELRVWEFQHVTSSICINHFEVHRENAN